MGNRIVNYVPVKQGIYEQSETQKGDIGSVLEFEDGRKFVYSLNGTDTLTPGLFCNGPIENTSDFDEAVVLAADIAIGDTTVSITTLRSYTANELKDGWVIVEDTGTDVIGHMRKIKSHPAATAAAETLVLTVYDAWTDTAASGTDTVNLLKNPYNKVMANVATTVGPLLGVAPIDVTASYYFWLQVAGPAPMIAAEAITVGQMLCVDVGAGLAYLDNEATDQEQVGLAMQAAESGNGVIVWLNLR